MLLVRCCKIASVCVAMTMSMAVSMSMSMSMIMMMVIKATCSRRRFRRTGSSIVIAHYVECRGIGAMNCRQRSPVLIPSEPSPNDDTNVLSKGDLPLFECEIECWRLRNQTPESDGGNVEGSNSRSPFDFKSIGLHGAREVSQKAPFVDVSYQIGVPRLELVTLGRAAGRLTEAKPLSSNNIEVQGSVEPPKKSCRLRQSLQPWR